MLAAIVTVLASAAPSIPVQAEWEAGTQPAITVSIAAPARAVRLDDEVAFDVAVAVDQGPLRISPFLAASRGVSFEVTDAAGTVVGPLEPLPLSPPAPPVRSGALVGIEPGKPLPVQVQVPAKNLFPGAGTFTVRARLRFMDASSTTPRYLSATSDPAIVNVTM